MNALYLLDAPVTLLVPYSPDDVEWAFQRITRLGKSDWILIPAALITLIAWGVTRLHHERTDRPLRIAALAGFIFFAVAVPGIVALIIKRLVGRARPIGLEEYGIWHFEPNIADWTMQSFPSGDTTTIFAFAMALIFLVPRLKRWWLTLAVLVALSRVMVGMHFPTDLFGGVLVGTFGAYAVRNYYLHRGWLFNRDTADRISLKSTTG